MLRIKFNSKQLLKERRDRVEKVYQNKRPDRVPFSFFPDAVLTANYASYTVAEATTNYEVMYKVGLKWLEDFNVDGIDTPPFGLFNLTIGMPVLPFVLMDYIPGPFTILLTGNTHRILKDRSLGGLVPSFHLIIIRNILVVSLLRLRNTGSLLKIL
uniref:Uncharacterized protein n=1 Tax=Ignisphaera aggregans TaxID=334771 RepID=A0A7C5UTW8_9CREN